MESDYQASRLLWLRAGWLKNVGRRNTRETGPGQVVRRPSASERAAGDAVQIHGANGYSDEYPVGRFYRNCKGAVIYEGTREIHKIMQADYLLGYRTDKPTRCELPAWESMMRPPLPSRPNRPPTPLRTRFRPLARLPARRRAGGHRLRAHDGTGRPAQVRPGGGRGDAPGDGLAADRRHHRHRRGRARRGADALHRREGRAGPTRSDGPRHYPAGRHRRRPARRHQSLRHRRRRTRWRCWPPRSTAACCTRPTSTWRSWSSGRARATSSISTRRCGSTCARSRSRSAAASRTWSSSCSIVRATRS